MKMPNITGPKTLAIGFNFLSLIPSIIAAVNLFGHGATGEQKKDAAMNLLKQAGGQAVAAVIANNPKYAAVVGQLVDDHVAALNASGAMPEPIATPEVPQTAPAQKTP